MCVALTDLAAQLGQMLVSGVDNLLAKGVCLVFLRSDRSGIRLLQKLGCEVLTEPVPLIFNLLG